MDPKDNKANRYDHNFNLDHVSLNNFFSCSEKVLQFELEVKRKEKNKKDKGRH